MQKYYEGYLLILAHRGESPKVITIFPTSKEMQTYRLGLQLSSILLFVCLVGGTQYR